jgi:hypothetical protein
MYVNMQRIGNELSRGQGWNDQGGRAAIYRGEGLYNIRSWKPDQSICNRSSGLLLSCKIDECKSTTDQHGALMVWYDAQATLVGAELKWIDNTRMNSGDTGLVKGSDPSAVGQQIDKLTPKHDHFTIGAAAKKAIIDFSKCIHQGCKIISIKSGKALTIEPAKDTQSGAKLQQWDYTGADNQKWRLVPVSPTRYLLASFKSSQVLDVPGHSTANNTEIVQWGYNGGDNQHWTLNVQGENDYTIESVLSRKVLDVYNASTDNGAPIQQYSYGQALNQRWRIDGV